MKARPHDETPERQDSPAPGSATRADKQTARGDDARTGRRTARGLPGGVRPLDLVIIALVIGLTVFSGFAIYGNRGKSARLVIEGPSGRWLYPLDRDVTVPITGPLGDTVVEIKGGKARIARSPCPNQTCVAAPAIDRPGEWNACLPNEVIIRVENDGGEKDGGIDAFAE